ncbi:MAG: choice-of-anchor tandem repeat GloVer-containing protein [Bryobacteraceae bacterium]
MKNARVALVLFATTALALPAQTITTLHSFDGTDGAAPDAALVQAANGDGYGTTALGGDFNSGAVFRTTPGGSLQTLYSFCAQSGCPDGAYPQAALVQGKNGDLYGATEYGGANNASGCNTGGSFTGCGTIFKMTPNGKLTTLYSFCSQSGCADGQSPQYGLVQAANGDLYGTTSYGGANCAYPCGGTIFKITPAGSLTTLYSFCAAGVFPGCTDGENPAGGLAQGANGDFYGTTVYGGAHVGGTVFKITGSGKLTTLYTFCAQGGSACGSGLHPYSGLVRAANGDFYGTTANGGSGSAACVSASESAGCGTIFKITPSGTLSTIYRFCAESGCLDGLFPSAGLIQATDGNFYGSTSEGGANNACTPFYACGTIFKITPGAALTTLYNFCSRVDCADGSLPNTALAQFTNGDFYGTTVAGGVFGDGTLFSLSVGLGPSVQTEALRAR